MAETKHTKIKVMDVAKPGSTVPDASSKPVIVGHRPMVADPMVSAKEKPAESEDKKEESKPIITSAKKIEPISDDMKTQSEPEPPKSKQKETDRDAEEDSKQEEAPEESRPAEKETTSNEDNTEKPEDSTSVEQKKEKADEEAAKALQAEQEREAKVQEIIESKKYAVDINDSSTASIKTFILTVLIILIVGVVGLALAIDAELVDLGIELPFDLIK